MSDADEDTKWDLPNGSTVRRQEQIGDPGFGLVVRWAFAESDMGVSWVDFAVYEQTGRADDGTIYYPRPGAASSSDVIANIDDAEVFIHGFVKFDGCTQWWQNGGGHVDHRVEFERVLDAIKLACRVAMTELLTHVEEQEY